jgi:hypothetical protein
MRVPPVCGQLQHHGAGATSSTVRARSAAAQREHGQQQHGAGATSRAVREQPAAWCWHGQQESGTTAGARPAAERRLTCFPSSPLRMGQPTPRCGCLATMAASKAGTTWGNVGLRPIFRLHSCHTIAASATVTTGAAILLYFSNLNRHKRLLSNVHTNTRRCTH